MISTVHDVKEIWNFLEINLRQIKKFLLREERLMPEAIGELLGEGDKDSISVMHAYVDLLDFKESDQKESYQHHNILSSHIFNSLAL